ncbi:MAG: low specificity L-threonine aldolase [Chthoniobacterales bacterium]|nr:low specificity L-threonine aldolase [Chthoniobacterales bacterium]
MNDQYHFASDNTAGVCPEAWEALRKADSGFEPSYGADTHTETACRLFREFFETDCEVFFVFNGTAANSLALASLCQSYHSVIAHASAHVETDECGAPEFFSNGTKLLLGVGQNGKLDVASAEALVTKRKDIHYPRPRVLSVSQPTELGTCYTPGELSALSELALRYGLKIHMDGARFFLSLIHLGVSPSEVTWKVGVDVLCFGGTKSGLGFSEAVVFFDKNLAEEFDYRCKQSGQLASKMRYLSAPWTDWLGSGTYVKYAKNAIACARSLAAQASDIPGVELLYPVEANAVFLRLPPHIDARLQSCGWKYYRFIGDGTRFMCSWQTKEADVGRLIADMKSAQP